MTGFVVFPKTPYLHAPTGHPLRSDKVLTEHERDRLLHDELIVEEKVDGENLGISCEDGELRFQSRGGYVELGGRHFRGLASWIAPRQARLVEALGSRFVVFGEWCSDVHSVHYDALPDWLLVFDLYDRDLGGFVPVNVRSAFAATLGLSEVEVVGRGRYDLEGLERLIGPSRFGATQMEGVVVRAEDADRVTARAKLVAPHFVQAIDQHWTRAPRRRNRLRVAG